MLGPIARISNQTGYNAMRSFVRNGSHGGVPGENLPFSITNKVRLTINFLLFGATGFGAPFLVLLHQLRKK